MAHFSLLVIVVIITALAFDFTKGFHDTANAMATSIATGALRPRWRCSSAVCSTWPTRFCPRRSPKPSPVGSSTTSWPLGNHLCGTGRCDPVEPGHLADRAALKLLTCAVRRADRRGVGRRRNTRCALRPGDQQDLATGGGVPDHRGYRCDDRNLPGLPDQPASERRAGHQRV